MKNPAVKDMQGWAWNCGIVPLCCLFNVDYHRDSPASLYDFSVDCLRALASEARLVISLPKTFAAFKREGGAFRRIERDLYREFLPSGVQVAETMPLAFKIGVFQFGSSIQGSTFSKNRGEILSAIEQACLRAEVPYKPIEAVMIQHLNGKISPEDIVREASGQFYEHHIGSDSIWRRFLDSIQLSPNIAGVGINLKKLIGKWAGQ